MSKFKARFLRILAPIISSISPVISRLQSIGYHREVRRCRALLLKDIESIDMSTRRAVESKIRKFCRERGFDEEKLNDWLNHTYRFVLSKRWLDEDLDHFSGEIRALDLGGEGVASDYWRAEFPDVRWENTDWDLRQNWALASNSFDLITATEILEHISDPANEAHNEGFYRVGVKQVLKESYRVLKPGGVIFITTPNASSIVHLNALLRGDPPWLFYFHVREYTLDEIQRELSEAGFRIDRSRDIHCLRSNVSLDISSLFQILLQYGYSTQGRGDEIFITARKPVS